MSVGSIHNIYLFATRSLNRFLFLLSNVIINTQRNLKMKTHKVIVIFDGRTYEISLLIKYNEQGSIEIHVQSFRQIGILQ